MLDNRVAVVPEQRTRTDEVDTSLRGPLPDVIAGAVVAPIAPGSPTAHGDVDPSSWAVGFLTPQCRARLSKDDAVGTYHGRCQLARGHEEAHGFKHGFIVVQWRTLTEVR